MLALYGGWLMRHTPHMAQQPGLLPSGQGQHDRKDHDSKHGFRPVTLPQQTGQPPHICGPAIAGRYQAAAFG
jgi:hypothetical protein